MSDDSQFEVAHSPGTVSSIKGSSGLHQGQNSYLVFISIALFVTTLGQPLIIGNLPINLLLKEQLHLQAQAVATFGAIATFSWNLKPLAGIASDSIPLWGTRRRSYLMLSAAVASSLWLLLIVLPRTYFALLWVIIIINSFIVVASTAIGGLLVESGQQNSTTGRLSSIRLLTLGVAGLLAGPIGGFLATRPFGLTAFLGAILMFALLLISSVALRGESRIELPKHSLQSIWKHIQVSLASKALWIAAGMMLLVGIAPGFGIPLLYYQSDILNFSPQLIGNLMLISSLGGLLAAVVYAFACKRIALRRLLILGLLLNVCGTLGYLFYNSPMTAVAISAEGAFVTTLSTLPLFDLAARAAPKGCEAMGYALLMSVWNIASSLSDVNGSWIYDTYNLTFKNLVWLNAGTSALAIFVVPFISSRLIDWADGSQPIPQS